MFVYALLVGVQPILLMPFDSVSICNPSHYCKIFQITIRIKLIYRKCPTVWSLYSDQHQISPCNVHCNCSQLVEKSDISLREIAWS